MPPQVKNVARKALFADEIWVYGSDWKETLLQGNEYSADQINVLGYYPGPPDVEKCDQLQFILKHRQQRKIIVVATQTKLFSEFIDYLHFLIKDMEVKNQFADFVLVIKPHPNEPKGRYDVFADNQKVFVYDQPVENILRETFFLVSCYSTVIVEALKFNISCFSIFIERCRDYIDEFVRAGYSTCVFPNENFMDKLPVQGETPSRRLFEKVNVSLITSLMQNGHAKSANG
jgi:hypothetical protein